MNVLVSGMLASLRSERNEGRPSSSSSSELRSISLLYAERLSSFKSKDRIALESAFHSLHYRFCCMDREGEEENEEDETRDTKREDDDSTLVWDETRRTLLFRPLLVGKEGRSTFSHQREAFLLLLDLWSKEEEEVVDRLLIDVRDASTHRIGVIMRRTTRQEVVDGVWIWRTFPCRIRSVFVLEPRHPLLSYKAVKSTSFLLLPKKVRRKMVFLSGEEADREAEDESKLLLEDSSVLGEEAIDCLSHPSQGGGGVDQERGRDPFEGGRAGEDRSGEGASGEGVVRTEDEGVRLRSGGGGGDTASDPLHRLYEEHTRPLKPEDGLRPVLGGGLATGWTEPANLPLDQVGECGRPLCGRVPPDDGGSVLNVSSQEEGYRTREEDGVHVEEDGEEVEEKVDCEVYGSILHHEGGRHPPHPLQLDRERRCRRRLHRLLPLRWFGRSG